MSESLPFKKPKVRLFGDPGEAQKYLGAAYNLMFKAREICRTSGTQVCALRASIGNALIEANILGREESVTITVETSEASDSKQETESLAAEMYIGLPSSFSAQFGWFPPTVQGDLFGAARTVAGAPVEALIKSPTKIERFTDYLAGTFCWIGEKEETVSFDRPGNYSKYAADERWLRVVGDPVTAAYTTAVPISGERTANYAAAEVTGSQKAPDVFILGKRVKAPFSVIGACEHKGKLIVAVPGVIYKSSSGSTSQSVYRLDLLWTDSPRSGIQDGSLTASRIDRTWTLFHSVYKPSGYYYFGPVMFSPDGTKAIVRSSSTLKWIEVSLSLDNSGNPTATTTVIDPIIDVSTAFNHARRFENTSTEVPDGTGGFSSWSATIRYRSEGRSAIAIDYNAKNELVCLYREGNPSSVVSDVRSGVKTIIGAGFAWTNNFSSSGRLDNFVRATDGSIDLPSLCVMEPFTVQTYSTYYVASPVSTATWTADSVGSVVATNEVLHADLRTGVYIVGHGERRIVAMSHTVDPWPTYGSSPTSSATSSDTATTGVVIGASAAGTKITTPVSSETWDWDTGTSNYMFGVMQWGNGGLKVSTNSLVNVKNCLAALGPDKYIVSAPAVKLQTNLSGLTTNPEYLSFFTVGSKEYDTKKLVKPPVGDYFRFNPVKVR